MSDRAAWWGGVLEDWRESGESVASYCRRHGLSASSLYRWRRRLSGAEDRGDGSGVETARFLPVRVVGSVGVSGAGGQDSGVEVVVHGGRRLRLSSDFDVEALVKVMAVLEGLPC